MSSASVVGANSPSVYWTVERTVSSHPLLSTSCTRRWMFSRIRVILSEKNFAKSSHRFWLLLLSAFHVPTQWFIGYGQMCPFPTDLVAEHSARMPPEGARDTFPLNASFVEGREATFGAPPHSGPLLTHIFWSALSVAYIYFDHSSWTHQRWRLYAYLHWPTIRRLWMSIRRPSKYNARPKRTESHGYPSIQDPILGITCPNDRAVTSDRTGLSLPLQVCCHWISDSVCC